MTCHFERYNELIALYYLCCVCPNKEHYIINTIIL